MPPRTWVDACTGCRHAAALSRVLWTCRMQAARRCTAAAGGNLVPTCFAFPRHVSTGCSVPMLSSGMKVCSTRAAVCKDLHLVSYAVLILHFQAGMSVQLGSSLGMTCPCRVQDNQSCMYPMPIAGLQWRCDQQMGGVEAPPAHYIVPAGLSGFDRHAPACFSGQFGQPELPRSVNT
jgi:hypothetical protein